MLLCILRIFWEASSARRFQHNLWVCSILEQVHGTVHSEELSFRNQSFAYFSWTTFYSLTGLSLEIGTAGDSAFRPSCSCTSHSSDTVHFAFVSTFHGREIISSLQCMGVQFVLFFHHGSFRFHFAQWQCNAIAYHPHQEPLEFFSTRPSCIRR